MNARVAFICDEKHESSKAALILHFDQSKIEELGLEGMPTTELKHFGLSYTTRWIKTPLIFDLKTQQWIPDVTKPKVCSVRHE